MEPFAIDILRQHCADDDYFIGHVNALHKMFISKMVYDSSITKLTLPEINTLFCTNFHDGLFRMICIKLLCKDENASVPNQISDFQNKLEPILRKQYQNDCYEIISLKRFNGYFVILNYPHERDSFIISGLHKMMLRFHTIAPFGSNVAICVGGAYHWIDQLKESKQDIAAVGWSRRLRDEGGILFYRQKKEISKESIEKFDYLTRKMMSACDALSTNSFISCMDELFSLPTEILTSEKTKAFMQETKEYMFSAHKKMLKAVIDVEQQYTNFERQLWLSRTFREYKNLFIAQFHEITEIIRNHQAVQQPFVNYAVAYVHAHFSEDIDIKTIANHANLSPTYFSAKFKAETGEKFTNFLQKYRIQVAKTMLRESDNSVAKIGRSVGFYNTSYFCQVFKRITGCTPSEYRSYDSSTLES